MNVEFCKQLKSANTMNWPDDLQQLMPTLVKCLWQANMFGMVADVVVFSLSSDMCKKS